MIYTCTHIWLLDPPGGPTSQGVCKLCAKSETFPNALPETVLGSHAGDRVRTNRRRGRESTSEGELARVMH